MTVNLTDHVCAHINEPQYKHEADKVVEGAAFYTLYQTLVGSLLPVVCSLFVGELFRSFPFVFTLADKNGFLRLLER